MIARVEKAVSMKSAMACAVLFAASLAFGGCQSEPGSRLSKAFSHVHVSRIENPGAGLPAGSGDAHFKKGFLLCNGSHESKEIFIVEAGWVTRAWEDWSVPERWRKSHRQLTADENTKIAGYLKSLEGQLGQRYINTKVADGLVMWLYETPDALGKPVLQSNNGKIEAFDALFELLEGDGVRMGMPGKPLDEATAKLRNRAMAQGR